jgi:hypothetical protein
MDDANRSARSELLVTKLDAAKRQIETAILLYFHGKDPVSIHTLMAAAYGILQALNKHREGEPMVKEHLFELLDTDEGRTYQKRISEAENFFKHADKDPHAAVKFVPESTELLLCEAANKYCRLSGEVPPLLRVFIVWFSIQHPHLSLAPYSDIVKKADLSVLPTDRKTFFDQVFPRITGL